MGFSMDNQKRCMSCMRLINKDEKVCPHCGFQEEYYQVEFYHLPVGQTLQEGRYQIGRVIGEGGFGLTYIGWDGKFSQVVAVKEFYSKEMVSRDNTISHNVRLYKQSDEEKYRHDLERVEREARTLKQFAGYPGIVRVEDYFEENNTIYIVMEYVEGRTLEQYLKQTGGRMDADKCLSMFRQLLGSLHSIHKAGVVHRDISMTNIMVRQDESLVLVDFGSARPLSQETTGITVKLGYAPLEQYMPDENNQGPWLDVYTICVCLYKCLTGTNLQDSKLRGQEDIWLNVGNDVKVSRNLKNTLKKGLELDYRKRFQSIDQIYKELYGEWLEPPRLEENIPKPDINKKGIPGKQWLMKYKKQTLLSCGVVAVLIALGVVWWQYSGNSAGSASQETGAAMQTDAEPKNDDATKTDGSGETEGEQKEEAEEESEEKGQEEEPGEETEEEEWTDQEGNRYTGIRKDGLLEGDGTCVYANGDSYTGQWVKGRPNGEGIREYTNGNRYEGEFKDGLKEGYGVFYYAYGDRYEGEWVDDQREGNGTYYWKDGSRYEGEWVDGQREGSGINYYASGDHYEGEWVDDQREGNGTYYWKDIGRYEGEWSDDKRNGEAIFYRADGTMMLEYWENGEKISEEPLESE